MSQNVHKFMFPALLCLGLLCGAAELPLDRKQLKAQYRAKAQLTSDGILLKSDTAEWDSGVQINPPEGRKFDFSNARYLARGRRKPVEG